MTELNCNIESENLTDGNKIFGSMPKLINTKINFLGKNNILYCNENVEIINSTLNFNCDNSLIFLNKGLYYLNAAIHFDSVLYIGENNYFNPGGNPIKQIKKNICWPGQCVDKWDKNMTAENECISDDSIIYKYSKKILFHSIPLKKILIIFLWLLISAII